MAFTDLLHTPGSENMAGLVGKMYYCPIDDILTFPALSAVGSVLTVNNFACKPGKRFYEIYHTLDTGKLDDTSVGERDGKSFEVLLEFFHPGAKQVVEEFKRQALNTPCVVICKDTEANLRLLGVINLNNANTTLTGDIPAYIESIAGTSGAARADRRGSTFQIKSSSAHPPLFYAGTIPLTPAP